MSKNKKSKVQCFKCKKYFKVSEYQQHRASCKPPIAQRPTQLGPVELPEELRPKPAPKTPPEVSDVGPSKPKKEVEPTSMGKVDKTATEEYIKPTKTDVTLEYHYSGTHKCGTQAETIILDDVAGKDKVVAVAWCPTCKEKFRQRITHKL